jgi:head-tail adaptor
VAFDEPTGTTDTLGGTSKAWTERHAPRAQWIYTSGNEGVQAARVAGREVYKVKIRSCAAARAITPAYQMRDTQRSTVWDIRSVDAIADRAWVYITVEGPQP